MAEIMEPFEFPEVNEGVKKALEILRKEWDGPCLVVFIGDMKPRVESSAEIVGRIIRDHDAVLKADAVIKAAEEAPIIGLNMHELAEAFNSYAKMPRTSARLTNVGKGSVKKKDRPKPEKRRRGGLRKK